MKKNTFCIAAIAAFVSLIPMAVNGQVGIQTANPASTLDITAKNATGATTNVDGLLIPRVDRQRAQSMTGVPTSTMIYISSIATGAQTGTAANIDAVGYYFYNGTVWTKLNSGSSSSTNIYNTDGTLTGNRTVTQGANTLAFNGTAVNAFSVDGSTLSVDATNNRVGIGTTSPSTALEVQGSGYFNGAVASTKNALDINIGQDGVAWGNRTDNYGINIKNISTSDPTNGAVARINFGDTSTSGSAGTRYLSFSVGKTPNELMYLTDINGGGVGIGTTAPGQRFSVVDSGNANQYNGIASFYANNVTAGVGIGYGGIQAIGSNGNNNLNLNAQTTGNVLLQAAGGATGNVGIGTTTPAQKLHVEGTARITGSTGTATALVGRNASGDISNLTLGTGLSITGGALNVAASNTAWNLLGNTGTTVAGNFIGTTDNVDFVTRTNNTEKMRVTAAGNVGIGNAAPNGSLQFANTEANRRIVLYEQANNDHQFYGFGLNSSTLRYQVSDASGNHIFFSGATATTSNELMRITGAGNVGIGTPGPAQKLHVQGAARITGSASTATAIMGRDVNGDISNLTLGTGLSITGGALNVAAGASTNIYNTDGTLTGNRTVTQGANTLAFNGTAVNSFAVDGSTLSVDAANNRVGIGTSAPAAALDVQGTARIATPTGTPTTITGRDDSGNIGNVTVGTGLSLSGGTLTATATVASPEVMRIGVQGTTASNNGITNLSFSTAGGLNTIAGSTVATSGITLPTGVYRISTNVSVGFSAASTTQYMELYIPGQGDIRHGVFSKPVATSTQGFISGSTLYNIAGSATINIAVFTANVTAGNTWSAATGPSSFIQIERIH